MKKYAKIVSVLLILMLILSLSTSVFATNPTNYKGDTNNTGNIEGIGQRIIGILQVVGSLAAVAILIVLGIKYMMGSAEEKAEYKKTMIPYIIGAILIFAAANIAGIVYSWANTL